MSADLGAQALKACCATGYSCDVVSLLLGDSYHPGGLWLTRQLLDRVGLTAGQHLVDVACGTGTSALLAAREYGARVDGIDLSEANVSFATRASASAALADRADFHVGDAENIPLPDGSADVVLCECALCTFPDKATAMAEMARLLVPGGRIGITDVAADRARLPEELTGLTGWIACVADARPLTEYADLTASAGLRVLAREPRIDVLAPMIDQIEARLALLRMTARPRLEALGVDFAKAGSVIGAARTAVRNGALDYVLLIAEKPWE